MTFIPYSRQEITQADIDAVRDVLRSDFLTQGPMVPKFEKAIATLHDAGHAVALSNATAALHVACLALGVDRGDLVWTSPISFVASANCALYCGAEIDFVDIDPGTRNISVSRLETKLEQASRAGRLPKVVIPVDFSGLPSDMEEIRTLSDRYGFSIVEDASHAVAAEYKGRPVGSGLAHITVFSFHPVKIVTTGEGGACVTNDPELAEKMRLLRSHGITRDPTMMQGEPHGPWYYEQIALGFNYRLTDIQAALGISQLARLQAQHERRDALARRYDALLEPLPLKTPPRLSDRTSSHHLYVIEIDETRSQVSRERAFDTLRAANIGANVHYIPIHLQPYYRRLGFRAGDFPNSERFYAGAITLPLFPAMTDAQQDRVVSILSEIFD